MRIKIIDGFKQYVLPEIIERVVENTLYDIFPTINPYFACVLPPLILFGLYICFCYIKMIIKSAYIRAFYAKCRHFSACYLNLFVTLAYLCKRCYLLLSDNINVKLKIVLPFTFRGVVYKCLIIKLYFLVNVHEKRFSIFLLYIFCKKMILTIDSFST